MNVCFLIRAMDRGGAELQLVRLATALAERRHAVTVLTYYEGGALEADLARAGVALRSLGKTSRWQLWQPLLRLAAAVRTARADVLHAYLPTSNVLALLARPLLPRATRIVAGVRASNMSLSRYEPLTAWSYRMERVLIRFADAVICNSAAAAALYARFAPADRIRTIANGIDTSHFVPDDARRVATRQAWGIGSDVRLVGLVARADPMKDHRTFLAAAACAARSDSALEFVCITPGDSPGVAALQRQAAALGIAERVHWHGPYGDLAPIYPAFDLVTLTSAYGEGFPNVLAEAMACGVACVATDVGDAAAIVGGTGRVVPPADADALAAAWLAQLDEPSDGGEASPPRRRIVENFSVRRMVDRTEAALREVAG